MSCPECRAGQQAWMPPIVGASLLSTSHSPQKCAPFSLSQTQAWEKCPGRIFLFATAIVLKAERQGGYK